MLGKKALSQAEEDEEVMVEVKRHKRHLAYSETQFNPEGREIVEIQLRADVENIANAIKHFKYMLRKHGDGFMNPSYKSQFKDKVKDELEKFV